MFNEMMISFDKVLDTEIMSNLHVTKDKMVSVYNLHSDVLLNGKKSSKRRL